MDCKKIAAKIAEESIVLLKNEGQVLPLQRGEKAALFGRMQIDMIYSGSGSGAASAEGVKNILQTCTEKGLAVEPGLKAYYEKRYAEEAGEKNGGFDWEMLKNLVNSGMMYEIFGKYKPSPEEYEISEELLQNAKAYTDTAVLVLGRSSGGEECDRHLYDDYYLTDAEKKLIDQVNENFSKVVLILNINGLVDLSWIEEKKNICSVLYIGAPGQEGAEAVAALLMGEVTPSGKLAVTIAKKYEDYPAAEHFSWTKDDGSKLLTYESYGLDAEANGSTGFAYSPVTVYKEGIFTGYRYFDTFGVEPLYPFGFGLSYTSFAKEVVSAEKKAGGLELKVSVKNTGSYAGKEVLQLYSAADNTRMVRPCKELKAFEKTALLKPGEEETLTLFVNWRDLASYEEEKASYVISAGTYTMLLGTSSCETVPVVQISVKEEICTEKLANRLGVASCNEGKIEFLKAQGNVVCEEAVPVMELDACEVTPGVAVSAPTETMKEHFAAAHAKAEAVVQELSVEQLAAMCVGYGPGTPFAGLSGKDDPPTIYDPEGNPITESDHPNGHVGYVSPAIKEKEIVSIFYKDGPAGVGAVAWPTEMLMACAFNKELWYAFGDAVGAECEAQNVDYWLAPAVNMQRHPLGGRNFEYPSEDPYLAGVFGVSVAKGTQENHPVLVCPKHFAINEQETYRRGSGKKNINAVNSIIEERAAREIYLKPFEMLVKEAGVRCLMTSFNRINGTFAGENADLCMHILREEWGYEGYIVTDWGDMDVVLDGANAVAAGNDVVMPGGPPVIREILKGYEEGRVTRPQLEKAVVNLLSSNMRY